MVMSDQPKKPQKPQKLKARLPRGLADRGPAEIAATQAMLDTIARVYRLYGFEPVETPAMEYTDALGKFLPDQDRPNEGVFSFQDDDEQWISLRYDLTAPLARYVAENFQNLALPYRSYRAGYVYRNEKPGPGRFRQFMQFDADTVGSASPAADAEICMMAADTMEALGIPRGAYVVKVFSRQVFDGFLETVDLGGDQNVSKRLTVLRAFDKVDRLGLDGVRLLLGAGRRDESGDFTKGAELSDPQIERLLEFLKMGIETSQNIASGKGSDFLEPQNLGQDAFMIPEKGSFFAKETADGSYAAIDGWNTLEQIRGLVRKAGYGIDQIRLDPSVVRGLEYYTGPVYEVELLLDTKDEKGRPVRFGSVGGGGRYDGLVSRFRGEPVPATGFSIGVSRLQAALTLIGKVGSTKVAGPVVVTVFGGDIAHYQKMVAQLRGAGIRAELYLGNPKHSLGQQMKYADRRGSPCAIIQGSDEAARGEVLIKDLIAGASAGSDTADRDAYREQQQQAQVAVNESDLVAEVQALLKRHNISWK